MRAGDVACELRARGTEIVVRPLQLAACICNGFTLLVDGPALLVEHHEIVIAGRPPLVIIGRPHE